ncbi:MAG: hypothetical protein KKF56_02980 [Nanoarchaeota archaeon]|nr:hypothetical protein [Nanoarchaeota archaeon]
MNSKKILILGTIALIFVVLSFTTSWWFLVPAVIIYLINQHEILKGRRKK